FRLGLRHLLGDARDFARMHYAVMQGAIDARTGATFRLPRSVELVVDAEALVLSVGPLEADALPNGFERRLPFRGAVGHWWVDVVARGEREGASLEGDVVELRLPPRATLRAW